MSDNLVDYLRYGFFLPPMNADHPFCEFDAAVFSLVTYFPLTYVPDGSGFATHILLKSYCERTLSACRPTSSSTPPQTDLGHLNEDDAYTLAKCGRPNFYPGLDVLEYIERIPRYANVRLEMPRVTNDVWDRDHGPELRAQFGAVTFVLPYEIEGSKIRVITFRGTNGTLVGWKDDLYLALDNVNTKVKDEAVKYVSDVIGKNLDSKFVITGHSKGGYLAVYSFYRYVSNKLLEGSSYEDLEKQFYRERYKKAVFNFDGPGIKRVEIDKIKSDIGSGRFDGFKGMVVVFAPSSTVASLLLRESCQNETQCYVSSNEYGLWQHSLSTWLINREFDFSSRGKTGPFLPSTQECFSEVITKSISEFLEPYSGPAGDQGALKQSIDAIFLILENGTGRHQELPSKEDLLNCFKKLCYRVVDDRSFAAILERFLDVLKTNLENGTMSQSTQKIAAIAALGIVVNELLKSVDVLREINGCFTSDSMSLDQKMERAASIIKRFLGRVRSRLEGALWYFDIYLGKFIDILSS